MNLSRKQLLRAVAGAGAAAVVGPLPAYASSSRVIERDVCVIGGGASGGYAAVRLRDLGRSAVLVERKGRLGGHTETFHDPVTGGTTDIGVVAWYDIPIVQDLFGRFDVPLGTVAVVLVPVGVQGRTGLLVVRRAIPPVGELALVGGFVDADETWQQAGAREVYEEAGLVIDSASLEPLWFTSTEPNPNRVLLFGVAPEIQAADLPPFTPNSEASERGVVFGPSGLAFPLHEEAVRRYLGHEGPAEFTPL